MTRFLKKAVTGLTIASTLALVATPADAQRYRRYRHHNNDAAVAIGAGIIGLGIGAAISSNRRGGYYDNGYYDRGSYSRGYNRGYYGRRCVTRYEYDAYYDDYVRVRYC
jgi:hypothetical protein